MATFHIDEPREIGKKKDRLSSKEKMMVKNDMLEMLAHENTCVNCGNVINEDLKKWFKQKWVNIGKKKKGGGHPPCGTSGKKRGYAKCVPKSKANNMSKKDKESATRRKRSAQNKANRGGTDSTRGGGKKPIRVKTKVENIMRLEELVGKRLTEAQFDEAAGEKDACYHKVKSRYDVWPSAYASGALVKCRKVGAKNWGNKSKNESVNEVKLHEINMAMEKFTDNLLDALSGQSADLHFSIKHNNKIEKMMTDVMDVDLYHQVKDKKEMIKGLKKVKSNVAKIKSLHKSIFDKVLSDIDKTYKTFETTIQKRIQISESKKENIKETKVWSLDEKCWRGYEKKGNKKMFGKTYPNCVKKEGVQTNVWLGETELYYESNTGETGGYTFEFIDNKKLQEAEYQGRKVKLGKPMQGDTKKFKVYVKNDKGNVVKVNFGQGGDAKGGTMRIRKSNPSARKSFRARHNCDNPGPKHKARYWSCRKW